VAFDIDANGILNVSAKDTATGKQQQVQITASSGLSKDEVERKVREAETHAAEDARRKQDVELRNQTDALVYQTERMLNEHGAKLDGGERQAVDQALADARDALRSDDMDRIRRAHDNLTRIAQTLSQAVQREVRAGAGGGPQTGGAPSGSPQDAEVVDAEFTDTNERKAS
jgi:molecular chaperone DnaK